MNSICLSCSYYMGPWAETLRKDWCGCGLLLLVNKDTDEEIVKEFEIPYIITAKEIGIGWVTNGTMAYNEQILTKETTECKKYESK